MKTDGGEKFNKLLNEKKYLEQELKDANNEKKKL